MSTVWMKVNRDVVPAVLMSPRSIPSKAGVPGWEEFPDTYFPGFEETSPGSGTFEALPAPPAPPPTSEDVNAERDRRTDAGFTFNGVFYQSRPSDRENIQGAYALASDAIILNGAQPGDLRWHGKDKDFEWIAADDTRIPMDAYTMLAFGQAALDHKGNLIFAASDLKAMDPIPDDYATNESYWEGGGTTPVEEPEEVPVEEPVEEAEVNP